MKDWISDPEGEIGNPYNPFLKYSYIDYTDPNHPIRWVSWGECKSTHVNEVLQACKHFGRVVHVNTGTHGDPLGRTIFTHPETFSNNTEY